MAQSFPGLYVFRLTITCMKILQWMKNSQEWTDLQEWTDCIFLMKIQERMHQWNPTLAVPILAQVYHLRISLFRIFRIIFRIIPIWLPELPWHLQPVYFLVSACLFLFPNGNGQFRLSSISSEQMFQKIPGVITFKLAIRNHLERAASIGICLA